MRKILFALAILTLVSCNHENSDKKEKKEQEVSYKEALKRMKSEAHQVIVKEWIISGAYTYALLEENNKEFWAAISARELKTGATYFYKDGIEMVNFESKSLGKVFSSIWFINEFYEQEAQPAENSIGNEHKKTNDVHTELHIDQPEGAYSLAEIFSQKSALENKIIIVKGQVVKINQMIMNTNWIHIQDGTDYNGLYDLTITSKEAISFDLGDVVTFKGKLILNKDFGHGYKYDFLLEEAIKQ